MEQIENFKTLVLDVWGTEVMGADVGTLLTALGIVIFFMLLRGAFARFVIGRLAKFSAKTSSTFDDKLFDALRRPLSFTPVVVGLFVATAYLEPVGALADMLYRLEKSLIAGVIFWAVYNAIDPLSFMLKKMEDAFSQPMVVWLRKGMKLFVLLVAIATILETWGVKVGPIIAGLGLFGVAVALGAQDMFKNLIAGLTVIAEKRFQPGDWIQIEGVIDGTVEDIGFRSTLVRRFDKAPVHVPNAQLSDSVVTNYSNMTHRRIKWTIGVLYSSSIEQLRQIRDGIENYIMNNDDFAKPPAVPTFVRIDSFNDSSIDIMVYCFTKTTNWMEWLKIKEGLACKIKEIVTAAGSDFAFPSRTVYLETGDNDPAEAFIPPEKKKA